MKVERPPDEAPAEVPLPVEKPPEKVQNSPPPAPGTAQRVKGGAPKIEPSWQGNLMRQLQRFKRYPASAQSRKEEGVVLLSFSLDRSGHVLAHSIAHSSGHADLDNEVMAMICAQIRCRLFRRACRKRGSISLCRSASRCAESARG
jgi:protein TonB